MTQDKPSLANQHGMPRILIGLLAATPLLLLQGIYLSDIHGWDVWLSYGGIVIVLLILALGFVAGCVTECLLRRRYTGIAHRLPWLSIAGLASIFALPVTFLVTKPIVEQNPQWCRVYQSIRWESSKPHPTHAGNQGFALVFTARGNKAEHHFKSGYLNWSGEEPAGFADIDLAEQTFMYWKDGERVTIDATKEALRDRVGQSGIPSAEADQISKEIWQAMRLADANKPIAAQHGQVDPIGQSPFDYEDIKLGSAIWMAALVICFSVIARLTLPKQAVQLENEASK